MSKRPKVDTEILEILNDYNLFLDSDKQVKMPFCVDKVDRNHSTSLENLSAVSPLGNTILECEMKDKNEYKYTF